MSDENEARKAAVGRFVDRVEDMVASLASPDRVDLFVTPPRNHRPDGEWCTASVATLRKLLAAYDAGRASND